MLGPVEDDARLVDDDGERKKGEGRCKVDCLYNEITQDSVWARVGEKIIVHTCVG